MDENQGTNMPPDFRMYINVVRNKKIRRMMRDLGDRSFFSLVHLWCFTAENCPTGHLADMDENDIAEASDWPVKRAKEWCAYLEKIKLLDRLDDHFYVHEWEKMQPWITKDKKRQSEANRRNALIRWEHQRAENDANRMQSHMRNNAIAMQTSDAIAMQTQCPHTHTHTHTQDIATESSAHPPVPVRDGAPRVEFDRLTGQFQGIEDEQLQIWQDAFPNINVRVELDEIASYILANPSTTQKKNWPRFLHNQLKGKNERAAWRQQGRQPPKVATFQVPDFEPPKPRKVEEQVAPLEPTNFPWERVRDRLKDRVDPEAFEKWISPIECFAGDKTNSVTLAFPDTYTAKHVQDNFLEKIKDAMWDEAGEPFGVYFRVNTVRQDRTSIREVANA